jgi:hypothetical protein
MPTYRMVQIHLHLHTRAKEEKSGNPSTLCWDIVTHSFLLILANVLILMLSTQFNEEECSKHFNADVKDCLLHKTLSG